MKTTMTMMMIKTYLDKNDNNNGNETCMKSLLDSSRSEWQNVPLGGLGDHHNHDHEDDHHGHDDKDNVDDDDDERDAGYHHYQEHHQYNDHHKHHHHHLHLSPKKLLLMTNCPTWGES